MDATQLKSSPQVQEVSAALEDLHAAQTRWSQTSIAQRLQVVQRFRYAVAGEAERLARQIELPQRNGIADTLAAEVMPLADACRFLERNAKRLLATRSAARADRPAWGRGLKVQLRREPFGCVLVIGTWNYPLFLTGVQTLQALVAGNAVLIKPGEGTSKVTRYFVEMLCRCGLPEKLIHCLSEDPGQCNKR